MWHRTRGVSSHSRRPHRTPHTYSQIIVLHKGDRIPEKPSHTAHKYIGRKNEPEDVFFVSPFGGKILWNMIIWNMGEILFFPAFRKVARTIVFYQILIL